MLKNITLGQYFPGRSIVHRLDPRTKLALTFVYIAALFTAQGAFAYLLMFAVLVTCFALSKISAGAVLRGVRPLIIIIAITAVLNIFFTGYGTVVVEFWVIRITREGIFTAAFMVARLFMLITGTFLLTYTTSPIALTDGLERMMNPLKKIRVPVHELAMMMSIALRFIPTLIEEADKIMNAQKARGADFETGGVIKRAKAVLPLIIPLFVSAFRRADELAVAMESRCYHGDKGRTRMKVLVAAGRDYAAAFCGAVLLAVVIVMRQLGI